MKKNVAILLLLTSIVLFTPFITHSQIAGFTSPDTICVTQNVNITNTSIGATSYYWNFCVADLLNIPPTGTNLGNPGNTLNGPVFSDFVEDGGNFYVFVVNHYTPTGIVRLDFGNSLLNTPTAVNLGNFGNVLRQRPEGIQVIQDNGKWYAFVVTGDPDFGDVPQLVRIDFGANIQNTNPVVTDLGDIGAMYQPLDLYMFEESGVWHAFTVNKDGSMSRFSFNNGLDNPPVAQNYPLGLNYPTGVNVINDNGKFYVFVTVALSNTIARLDFGNSLLNNPVVVDLGDPGNTQTRARDIYIMRFCSSIVGFIVNGPDGGPYPNELIRLDFNNDIEAKPSGISLGNTGNLNFPHSLSKLFRVEDKVYSFITNVSNNTITRLEFPSCNNASQQSFSGQNPPAIKYNAPGVYNINLTIDDGLPTQSSFCRQVVVVPEPAHTPVQTIILRPGESVKIGTGNISGNYKWNTTNNNIDSIIVTMEGLYYVETTGYGCSNIDSFNVVFSSPDFSYQQDVCDPLKLHFKNETPNSTTIDWDFGNTLSAPGDPNPTTVYAQFGNYAIKLIIKNSLGIIDSVVKQIPVNVQFDSLIITRDTTICKGAGIQLNAIAALNYCWTPSASLSQTDISNPIAAPQNSTVYYLNTLITGQNIIVNGDFSAGNTGFQSQYNYVTNNTTEGEYFVGNSSLAWNPHLIYNCTDHSGTGNMLLVNGSPEDNKLIWTQTINVMPNTNYAFSTWIESHFKDNPAQLEFSINSVGIGNQIIASLPICNWTQFYTTWNSGSNTSAVISIVNKNTISWGNDFALDDISFAPVSIKRDSVIINIEEPVIATNADTTVCEGISVQLTAQGNFVSYEWTPSAGLSGGAIANPLATPQITTKYKVTGTSKYGCKASDSLNITIIPKPLMQAGNDTILCGAGSVQLTVSGNASKYSWSPAAGLSDSTIANPMANLVSGSSRYIVTGESLQGCNAYDTVNIRVSEVPEIKINKDTTICEGNTVQLNTYPATVSTYTWSPAAGLSDAGIANPVAAPVATTKYMLTASNTDGCTRKDSVLINVSPKPVISLINDTTICRDVSVALNRGGSSSDIYTWSPVAGLSNPSVTNPVATPQQTTTYSVVAADAASGCKNEGSVRIDVRPYPLFSASGNVQICAGEVTRLQAGGGDTYKWTSAAVMDNPESNEIIVSPGVTTLFSVYIAENVCHFDTLIDVNVVVNQLPVIIAHKSNDINCITTTSQLSVTGGDRYVWSPSVNLDNANVHNPVASPESTTTFTVKGTNQYGCSADDSISVKVTKEGNPLYLVPNAFTPNNDGVNDCLSLKKWGYIQLEEFSIYNRWGEKIFTTKNRMDCWDGTYKGIMQPNGTFVYIIRAKTFCGDINRKGLVTLIR
ncbi:MAG: gliding motility-associated C-terminal domain-containing protein [Agriterribacter sp.]